MKGNSNNKSAQDWIDDLQLKEHPEGGYYRRVSPVYHHSTRAEVSSIYYLLKKGQCAKIHRFDSKEYWTFHAGGKAIIHQFTPTYATSYISLEYLQCHVDSNTWFGVELIEGDYLLCSCIVVPEFDMESFSFADSLELIAKFPEKEEIIKRLT